MPEQQGLFAAAIPPLAAAFFASSPYLQPGPTAVTGLLVFAALSPLATPGSTEYVKLGLLLALLVGVARITIGALGAGVVSYLLSPPLLYGFVPAVAILIVASQLPLVVGTVSINTDLLARAFDALRDPASWSMSALVIAAMVAVIVLTARWFHPLAPGVLIAVAAATLVSIVVGYDGAVVGSFGGTLPSLTLSFPVERTPQLLPAAAVIALLGFAEASSIARTYAAVDRSRWDPNREFVSQGVANVAASITNGMPVGASFLAERSQSAGRGADNAQRVRHRAYGSCVLPLGFLLAELPVAALGVIVIIAVLPLIRLDHVVDVFRWSRPQFAITITVSAPRLPSSLTSSGRSWLASALPSRFISGRNLTSTSSPPDRTPLSNSSGRRAVVRNCQHPRGSVC